MYLKLWLHSLIRRMTKIKQPYVCPRCGYSTMAKTNMNRHLNQGKNSCHAAFSSVILTDSVKEEILASRIFREDKSNIISTTNTTAKPKVSQKELRYQKILERVLRGTHKHLQSGITDVTTDTFHAEIKNWDSVAAVIKQLFAYNNASPRPELRAYMFGLPPDNFQRHINKFWSAGIKPFHIDLLWNQEFRITDLLTNKIVREGSLFNFRIMDS